jgi:hypothetical protein
LILRVNTHFLEIIQRVPGCKYQRGNRLGNSRAIGGDGFHFAVKIDFEGEGSSVKNRAAVAAVTDMPLDFACYFRRQPAFQVFAD